MVQNKLTGVPVFPVFLAEIVDRDINSGALQFEKFSSANMHFPDVPHLRDRSAQTVIDRIRY